MIAIFATGALAAGQSPATSTIQTGTLVIRGRFVDTDGKPIKRCHVRLTGHQSTGYDLAWSAGDWTDPPEITTSETGEFRFTFRLPAANEPRDRNRYHINCSHARYAHWFSHCTFEVASALGEIDYGDVHLPVGVRPRIRCVDSTGARQAGVSLWLKPTEPDMTLVTTAEFGPHSWIQHGDIGSTDIDGYLHLQDPVLPGEYSLTVRNRVALKTPESVTLPADDLVEAVIDAVPADDLIEGRLVDAAGEPLAAALLATQPGLGGPSCRSRRDGRFALIRDGKTNGREAQIYLANNRRYDAWAPVAAVRWGTRDAVIEVPAGTPVTFEVRTKAGAPVEDFNLYCLPVRDADPAGGVRRSGPFPGGRVTCDLAPAGYRVLVYPHSELVLPSDWLVVDVGDREAVQRVVLDAAVERTVRVVFADQGGAAEAVAGALVEVIAGSEPEPFAFVMPSTALVERRQQPASLRVASSCSDAQGMAVLHLPEPGGPVHLRVSGASIQTQVLPVDLTTRGEPIAVEVLPGARMTGSLGPIEAMHALDPAYDPKARPDIYSHQRRYGPTLTASR